MATVTGYTAAKMQEIEGASIVNGSVVDGDLILYKQNGTPINAGPVTGPQGIQGPDGDLTDAPSDGKLYVRKDGAWYILAPTAAPSDGLRYTLKNGAWQALAADPASDGNKYVMENGAWVRADRPWKLEFNQSGPTPPSGFSVSNLHPAPNWNMKFSGSGYNVNFNLQFDLNGLSLAAETIRLTFPASLRPVYDFETHTYAINMESGVVRNGHPIFSYNSDGTVKGPRYIGGLGVSQSGSGSIMVYMSSDPDNHKVIMNGSFTRSSSAIPSTATYV